MPAGISTPVVFVGIHAPKRRGMGQCKARVCNAIINRGIEGRGTFYLNVNGIEKGSSHVSFKSFSNLNNLGCRVNITNRWNLKFSTGKKQGKKTCKAKIDPKDTPVNTYLPQLLKSQFAKLLENFNEWKQTTTKKHGCLFF